uniref:Interleukin 18 receptor 1, gene 1 n=1 Tax=Xenopus tropicalis TaxID=8364 RepID=A0A6I8QAR4_XENTR
MFRGGTVFAFLVILCHLRSGNCQASRCAVDGEHYVLQCLWSDPVLVENMLKNNESSITWNRIQSDVDVKITTDNTSRIISKGHKLQFWPIYLNDSGDYYCSIQDTESRGIRIKVVLKSEKQCNTPCNEKKKTNMGMHVVVNFLPFERYRDSGTNYSIVVYKNCDIYAFNVSQISFDAVQKSDEADYAFVLMIPRNGRTYSFSRRTKLIVNVCIENIKPYLRGTGNVTNLDIELGTNFTLQCEAFLGYCQRALYDVTMFWLQLNSKRTESNAEHKEQYDFVEGCSSNITYKRCYTPQKILYANGSLTAITVLQINDANEYDVKNYYKCKMDTTNGGGSRAFNLRIKDGKQFDAYLSFMSNPAAEEEEEIEFATKTLPMVLENLFGYKLCIFERDVIPGGVKVDDMHSFLDKSRRLIILFSRNYIADNALYELEAGLHKAMVERKIKVILIECMPLHELNVVPESLHLLKSSNTVKWEGNKSRPLNSRFWKQIQYLMPSKPINRQILLLNDKREVNPNCY